MSGAKPPAPSWAPDLAAARLDGVGSSFRAPAQPVPPRAASASPYKRLVFPKLVRANIDRDQRISAHRHPVDLPGVQGFSLRLGAPDGDDADQIPLVLVDATIGQAPFQVRAPRELACELMQALGANVELDTMPAGLAGLLLEASITSLLTAMEEVIGAPITFKALRDGGMGPSRKSEMPLTIDGPDRAWPLRLAAAPDTLDLLLRQWRPAPHDTDWLPMPARIRLGTTTLGLDVLLSLRDGDVVLLETGFGDRSRVMLVVGEAFCAQATMHDETLELAEPVDRGRKEWTMSGIGPDDEEAGLDDLPVRLSFDLGNLDLALGDLRQLAAGTVLELGRGPTDLVEISANGRRIGRGELVELDGAVGVRIVRIFARE